MYKSCPYCVDRLIQTGFAAELYFLICKHYIRDRMIITLYEAAFTESLRYLESNRFIVTTEAGDGLVFAKPLLIDVEKEDKQKHCSGYCQHVSVDFKSE